jgi:phosphopentomutase
VQIETIRGQNIFGRVGTIRTEKMAALTSTDVDSLFESINIAVLIKEHEVKALCDKAREILIEESNLVRVKSPVSVSSNLKILT